MKITKGLIVADPWIGYLLDGSKTWEMRSTAASHRGWFGLIRKGTGAVYGVARLVDVGRPLSPEEMLASVDRHRIPADMIRSGEVAKWNTPWIIADARRLPQAVPYRHPYGAVTWVDLDPEVSGAIATQMGDDLSDEAAGLTATEVTRSAVRSQPALRPVSPSPHALEPAKGPLIGQVTLT